MQWQAYSTTPQILTGAGGPSIGQVDDTGNLLVGTINGRIKVYVDPYAANLSDKHYYVIGYKGTSPYDAGLFYCPYVPLQMVRSIDPNTFQPKIGFKTRYGMVSNPFVTTNGAYNGTPDGSTTANAACTTEEYKSRTSCDSSLQVTGVPKGPLFVK